jgi:hypothetical protein
MRRRLERDGAAIVMEDVAAEEDDPTHMALDPLTRRKRRAWSTAEWESLFVKAGFSSVTRIWSDGGRMAWMLRK